MTSRAPIAIEDLLDEEEGSALDFKQEQYRFAGASDDEKSELLKDILALANAWRRTDGYILVGVREVRGGRSEVVGVSEHLDDAQLQQFVNFKTQRPVTFSYRAVDYSGDQIGVIHVPVQERPIYLRRDYGKLKRNVVYIRRGSSTAEADPDEVARMGETAAAERAANKTGKPQLEMEGYVAQPPMFRVRDKSGGSVVTVSGTCAPVLDSRFDVRPVEQRAFVARVRVSNRPQLRTEEAVARDVLADVTYFDQKGQELFTVPGRWATATPQPSRPGFPEPPDSLRTISIPIGAASDLDVAIRYQGESEWFALDNSSFDLPMWKNPAFRLPATTVRVKVTLTGVEINKAECFTVHWAGDGLEIKTEEHA